MFVKIIMCLLTLGIGGLARISAAQTASQVYGDSLTKQAQTIYVKGTVGMTTFESEAAASKETQSTIEEEFGGWLGESRIAGIRVSHARASVPFELNAAQAQSTLTDVRVQARLWLLQPSIGISLSELDVERAGERTVGLFATGIIAGLGLIVNLHQGLVFNADLMKVFNTRSFDKLSTGSSMGDREDSDAFFAFDLTDRIVDLLIGYRSRRYTVNTAEGALLESSQGAYAGLRLGYYF